MRTQVGDGFVVKAMSQHSSTGSSVDCLTGANSSMDLAIGSSLGKDVAQALEDLSALLAHTRLGRCVLSVVGREMAAGSVGSPEKSKLMVSSCIFNFLFIKLLIVLSWFNFKF